MSPRAKVVKVAARPRYCVTFSKLDKSHCRPCVGFESRDRSNGDPGQMTILSNFFVSWIRTRSKCTAKLNYEITLYLMMHYCTSAFRHLDYTRRVAILITRGQFLNQVNNNKLLLYEDDILIIFIAVTIVTTNIFSCISHIIIINFLMIFYIRSVFSYVRYNFISFKIYFIPSNMQHDNIKFYNHIAER